MALTAAAHASASKALACDQERGLAEYVASDFPEAVRHLEGCGVGPEVSNGTLVALVTMYEAGHYRAPDKKITETMFELLRRDALLGNEDAIFSLAGIFASGEPLLGIAPQEAKEKCLLDIAQSADPYRKEAVEACLEDH